MLLALSLLLLCGLADLDPSETPINVKDKKYLGFLQKGIINYNCDHPDDKITYFTPESGTSRQDTGFVAYKFKGRLISKTHPSSDVCTVNLYQDKKITLAYKCP